MFNTTLIQIVPKDKWKNVVSDIHISDSIYSELGSPKTLLEINSVVNDRINYVRDIQDEWKSPNKTAIEGGDCEDLSILKMSLMLRAGYDPEDMFLVVGYDTNLRQNHALVAFKDNQDYLVLDNMKNTIFKDKDFAPFFRPMLSYNLAGSFIHGSQSS